LDVAYLLESEGDMLSGTLVAFGVYWPFEMERREKGDERCFRGN
jgi:hypothetical protein